MIRFFAILAGLFLLAGAASAQSCPTREDLALVGSAPGAQYGDCRELARFTIQTGREDIPAAIFGAADTDPRAVMQIRGALIKAGDTVKALAPLGSRPVKIYISPTQNVEPQIYEDAASQQGTMVVDAQTAPSVDRQTCVIGIFPPAMAASPQSRTHTVAHEFFHCVIITEYPHRDTARGATWWVEGAAEWFASHVYENTPESDGAVATFDQFSVETPLTRMAYGNVVFFWWLEQKYGTDGVFGLINAMPVRGSQDDALAGFMADSAFREFAKAYLDGDIVQPGGRVVASNPDFGATITVENGVPFEVSAPRHVLFRATVEFSCGLWRLRQQGLRGLYAAQPASSAVWGDLPETIDREYGETLQLAGGATEASGFFTKIMADKDFCAPCSVPDYILIILISSKT